jgi:uncharacterized membrane protein YqaE (UPF0057 family)
MVVKRGVLSCCNIFFPPLAVFLLTGAGEDLVINSILFLLAVIPSHIHGFYISSTYFNRKRKVRKGQYPGPWRPMIYSEKVQNGGATASEVRQFKRERDIEKYEKAAKKRRGGRVRGFFHRFTGRNKFEDIGSPVSSEEYPDAVGEVEKPEISRRHSSRIGAETPRLVQRSTRRHTSSYEPEIVNESQMVQRQATVRSQGASRNRQSQIEYEQQPILPTRHTSARTSRVMEDTRRQSQNHDDGGVVRRPSRRHATHGGLSTNRGSSRKESETLSDFVSRPGLPPRPGTSYRDDVDRWMQNVPVEAC